MGTSLIKPKQNGADLSKLTINQQKFVMELIANDFFNVTEAAKAAGYKNPAQAGNKLMRNKAVMRALGKAIRERNERCEVKADQVIEYLHRALFFNPLTIFHRGKNGTWEIDDFDKIPKWIGCLIESMESEKFDTDEGIRTKFKIKFVPHATTLALAMKHHGLMNEQLEVVQKANIDWGEVVEAVQSSEKIDPIKQAILDVESQSVDSKQK